MLQLSHLVFQDCVVIRVTTTSAAVVGVVVFAASQLWLKFLLTPALKQRSVVQDLFC